LSTARAPARSSSAPTRRRPSPDADVQQLIQQELTADAAVPQPGPSSLYYVFLPPGVTVTLDSAASCSSFCGYHSDINGTIYYAVMPYPTASGASEGCRCSTL